MTNSLFLYFRLTNKYRAAVLNFLLGLFAFRVTAQFLEYFIDIPYIPDFNYWHSNSIPYPFLLLLQVIILGIMWMFCFRQKVFSNSLLRQNSNVVTTIASFYLLTILVRHLLGLSYFSDRIWFTSFLSIYFHYVIALFFLIVGFSLSGTQQKTPKTFTVSNKKKNSNFWDHLIYPLSLSLVLSYYLFSQYFLSTVTSSFLAITFSAFLVTFFEYQHPERNEWRPKIQEIKADLFYLGLVQVFLPKILKIVVVFTILRSLQEPKSQLWPHHWPVVYQSLLMLVSADFLRYWLHRYSHKNKILWNLHSIHHSPNKLYWMNVGRFQPLEKTLQFCFDSLPFLLLGVHEDVFSLYFVFYATNGFFQHCNIKIDLGILNQIISGPQLHRWHHSKITTESNSNFGNNIIIWDKLFGTYFLPKNSEVKDLGITTTEEKIEKSKINLILLKIKMFLTEQFEFIPLLRKSKSPMRTQEKLLKNIVTQNRNTDFGKKHNFKSINDIKSFRESVPISNYEDLRPFIKDQVESGKKSILNEQIIMLNQTSGTTGKPKYIPVTQTLLKDFRSAQRIFALSIYKKYPKAFEGKILGIVSPSEEGRLEPNMPFGSASGVIYENMPVYVRKKYVLPAEAFVIEDYSLKYYLITLIALQCEDITLISTANPSTLIKIEETLQKNFEQLINDLEQGSSELLNKVDPSLMNPIKKILVKSPERASALKKVAPEKRKITTIWPSLKLITTWTKGSCGIGLNGFLSKQEKEIPVEDLGYLSSEFRGTLLLNSRTEGQTLNFRDVYFEFCEREQKEKGKLKILTMNQLNEGQEYYVYITNKVGLYRYDINDIIKVVGWFNNTPLIHFVQKGKGVTNITGEKLCESQVIEAMTYAERQLRVNLRFYKFFADVDEARYTAFLELDNEITYQNQMQTLKKMIEEKICELNIEYGEKLKSGRLKSLELIAVNQGTYEKFKESKIQEGMREGQFKTLVLEYLSDCNFNWRNYEN